VYYCHYEQKIHNSHFLEEDENWIPNTLGSHKVRVMEFLVLH